MPRIVLARSSAPATMSAAAAAGPSTQHHRQNEAPKNLSHSPLLANIGNAVHRAREIVRDEERPVPHRLDIDGTSLCWPSLVSQPDANTSVPAAVPSGLQAREHDACASGCFRTHEPCSASKMPPTYFFGNDEPLVKDIPRSAACGAAGSLAERSRPRAASCPCVRPCDHGRRHRRGSRSPHLPSWRDPARSADDRRRSVSVWLSVNQSVLSFGLKSMPTELRMPCA